MYKRVAFACSAANPQKILRKLEKGMGNAGAPHLPITGCLSVFEGNIHAT